MCIYMRMMRTVPTLLALSLIVASGCAKPLRSTAPATPDATALAQLWVEPDLERRDLFLGPGGRELLPDPTAKYEFVARDTSGWSPGYDVRDPAGLVWSVKLDVEAQSEVVTSRIVWAIGFHQPPTYYVERWTLSGQDAGPKPAGRFRPELPDRRVIADWSWYANPFVGTRPFGGLIAAQLILGNWDLKTSNNKIYELAGGESGKRRLYVVRDVGASLGATKQIFLLRWLGIRGGQGTKNDLSGFEKSGFIEEVDGGRVRFAYRGVDASLVGSLSPADVRWTCELMTRISDRQWSDAFRAGGYTPDETARYVEKIKTKIAQGLKLQPDTVKRVFSFYAPAR